MAETDPHIGRETSRIGAGQAAIVADYIAHNEFGLARDQLMDALENADLLPLAATKPLLEEADRLMGSSSGEA